jgi:hypothetical protein
MLLTIPPIPHTLSWRGAKLKHRDSFTFTVQKTFNKITKRITFKCRKVYEICMACSLHGGDK